MLIAPHEFFPHLCSINLYCIWLVSAYAQPQGVNSHPVHPPFEALFTDHFPYAIHGEVLRNGILISRMDPNVAVACCVAVNHGLHLLLWRLLHSEGSILFWMLFLCVEDPHLSPLWSLLLIISASYVWLPCSSAPGEAFRPSSLSRGASAALWWDSMFNPEILLISLHEVQTLLPTSGCRGNSYGNFLCCSQGAYASFFCVGVISLILPTK